MSRFFTLRADCARLRGHRIVELIDVAAPIYEREAAARLFDKIHGILRSLGFAQSLLKDCNAPIWRSGNRGVNMI